MLSSIGGTVGVFVGVVTTTVYATSQGWSVLIPPLSIWAALVAAVLIGAAAGLYPALRAAHLEPTDALRST